MTHFYLDNIIFLTIQNKIFLDGDKNDFNWFLFYGFHSHSFLFFIVFSIN